MNSMITPIARYIEKFKIRYFYKYPRQVSLVWQSSKSEQYEDHDDRNSRYFQNVGSSILLSLFGAFVFIYPCLSNNVSAAANDNSDDSDKDNDKKHRVGFRDRRVISYEDRLRAYSTPDKLFRYFATVRRGDNIFMTPDDFVRSITPGLKQPDGLGLDSFQKYNTDIEKRQKMCLSSESVFYRFGKNALISFPDYVFLLTLLSSPPRQFEVAFRMFDRNGDGVLEKKEFEVVRCIIMNSTAMGKRHRDREVTGNTLKGAAGGPGGLALNMDLTTYFFGKEGDKLLRVDDFLKFQAEVQREVSRIEFNRFEPKNGRIHEIDFAYALLLYAGFSGNKRKRMMRRIRQQYPRARDEEKNGKKESDSNSNQNVKKSVGITFEEYTAFFTFLRHIADVDTALGFYNFAGLPVDRNTFSHVARTVTKIKLSDRVVDIMFLLFDENEDNHLSQREFISVMKRRQMRCLDRAMDTGFVRYISSHFNCLLEQSRYKPLDESLYD